MRGRVFSFEKHTPTHRKLIKKLSVRVVAGTAGRLIHRTHRAHTFFIALAGILRFEFRLLSGRNDMRVFFQILDDFFGHHFSLKPAQRAFD
jgi:hypothetical protein